jgi:hypothetical protein
MGTVLTLGFKKAVPQTREKKSDDYIPECEQMQPIEQDHLF